MYFSPKYIKQLQKDLFNTTILNRGLLIFDNHQIIDIEHHKKTKKIVFQVQGSDLYSTTIKYLSTNQFQSLGCNCPYNGGFCKHIAAVTFYLLAHPDIDNTEAQVHEERHPKVNVELSKTRSNEFRELYFEDFDSFENALYSLQPDGLSRALIYARDFEYLFLEGNILNIKATPDDWYRSNEKDIDVDLKFKENNLSIKCNSCAVKSQNLCGHAYVAIDNLLIFSPFQSLLLSDVTYDSIIQGFADQESLTKEMVKEYFRPSINFENFYFVKTDQTFFTSQELSEKSNYFNDVLAGNRVTHSALLGNIEKINNYSNALWWSYSYDHASVMPILLEGKVPKSRNKLSSHINFAIDAFYLTHDQSLFYEKYLILHTRIKSLPDPIKNTQLLTFLKDNFLTLQSCISYLGKDSEVQPQYNSKLKKSALQQIFFQDEVVDINFELVDGKFDLLELKGCLNVNHTAILLKEILYVHPLFFVLTGGEAYFHSSETDYGVIQDMIKNEKLSFAKNSLPQILPSINLINTLYPFQNKSKTKIDSILLYGGKKELYFSELGQHIIIKPIINFEGKFKQNALSRQIENSIEPVLYDIKGEDAENLCDELCSLHDIFSKNISVVDFYSITVDEFLDNNWFIEFFERCKSSDISVFGTDLLENFKFNKRPATISASISSGIDWFESHIDIKFGKLDVPLSSWVEMVKHNQKYVKLSDGTLGLMPEEWIARLKALYNISEIHKNDIKISKYNFSLVDEYFGEFSDDKAQLEIKNKIEAFRNYNEITEYQAPKIIHADLRSYQLEGYRWLRFLDEYGLGGCLADDMGLGKTLQMLCLLAYKYEKKKCFALVIVPNSLIFNWANEIEKFCPSLQYLIHHGPNRDVKIINQKKFDVIITTYGTALADIDKLSDTVFDTVILDESQAIKNPNSKRYKAITKIQALHRYVMTGTPIENNTFDLFAQINFVNPGLFGNANSFKKKFSTPIDVNKDPNRADLLRRMIHPFLLRRTKEQVAKDLPEKTESIIYCEMGQRQKKYYDSVKNDIKNSLKNTLESTDSSRAKFQVLEGLLRLRQITNSPKLIDQEASDESVKIDVLVESIMANNTHKCLVFSQFVGMLQLIRKRLDEMHINYAYLDGSTKKRQDQVDLFQTDQNCKVFLISIKAGNTGLNLTAADYVYIIDPWWNPAVEAQAIDRTHRIGQVNHVFAYKLVCKDTIEEKILQLQTKKKNLADDIIRTDESILKSLDKDDLIGLFD